MTHRRQRVHRRTLCAVVAVVLSVVASACGDNLTPRPEDTEAAPAALSYSMTSGVYTRNLAIVGIVSGAVSFLVLPILFGPLGVLLGILGLARGERRLGTIAIVVSILGLVVGFVLGFLVLYLAEV